MLAIDLNAISGVCWRAVAKVLILAAMVGSGLINAMGTFSTLLTFQQGVRALLHVRTCLLLQF